MQNQQNDDSELEVQLIINDEMQEQAALRKKFQKQQYEKAKLWRKEQKIANRAKQAAERENSRRQKDAELWAKIKSANEID
ncbi:MAG: hypothetical protein KBD78_13510 [Oligoflexales bacterium]|nr:hypothetical protein [Oligoflexales bacterium]